MSNLAKQLIDEGGAGRLVRQAMRRATVLKLVHDLGLDERSPGIYTSEPSEAQFDANPDAYPEGAGSFDLHTSESPQVSDGMPFVRTIISVENDPNDDPDGDYSGGEHTTLRLNLTGREELTSFRMLKQILAMPTTRKTVGFFKSIGFKEEKKTHSKPVTKHESEDWIRRMAQAHGVGPDWAVRGLPRPDR